MVSLSESFVREEYTDVCKASCMKVIMMFCVQLVCFIFVGNIT